MVPPSAAPVSTPVDEAKRVDSLARPLAPSLDRLITDLSAPALELVESDPIFFLTGQQRGTATQRCIDRVLGGMLDPGSAALLGYKALDAEFKDPQPLLVFYWVSGLFRDFPPSATGPVDAIFDAQLAVLPPEARVGDPKGVVDAFTDLLGSLPVNLDGDPAAEMEPVSDYVGIGALAIADRSVAPDPMPTPSIDGVADGGWLPVTPPAARREVEVALSGVATAGLLAAEKQTPDGGAWSILNPANDDGYHLPLVLGMNPDDDSLAPPPEPGTGFLADRHATPDTIRYAVAQQDPFGRWSGWTSAVSVPGPRPAPPGPVIQATYAQPADPAASGGAIRVKAVVPRLEALAPGSFPIEQLEVSIEDGTTHAVTTSTVSVGDPLAPDEEAILLATGPVLAPTERRLLTVTAVWRDTAGTASVESEPATLGANDPRPPAQLTVPDALQYSGRPDALGLSMVEYAWTTTPAQATFGVYYTDENRLVASLAEAADGTPGAILRGDLAQTVDPAARATLIRANASLFPGGLFERLKGVVYEAGAGQQAFRHAVSGSLRVLNLYRIAAESASNAKPDISSLPILVFAVPNADPPPRPVLTVSPGAMTANADTYAATVEIVVTVGVPPDPPPDPPPGPPPRVTLASTWRLRRSSLGATEIARMPIVATGPVDAAGDDGRQRATYTDTGPVLISTMATLKPWVRYTYVAEVQGEPAPGSVAAGRPMPGTWSSPSDPVSVMLVPPRAPDPATGVAASGTAVGGGESIDVELTFSHPDVLSGGVAGAYRVRVARRPPGGAFEVLGEVPTGGGEGPYTVSGMRPGDAADQVPSGTLYRLWVIDPLGRESGPAEATLP